MIYNAGKLRILDGGLDSATLRAKLVMSNTTVDSENDGIAFLDDFTTIDQHDGSGYADVTLAGVTIAKDDSGDRATLVANNPVFADLGVGARNGAGVLIFEHVTDNTDSIPIAFLPRTFIADGSTITFRLDNQETAGVLIELIDPA